MCGGSYPRVEPAKPPPKLTDKEVQEAMAKERMLALKRKGRGSTILTPLVDDYSKTLLG